MSLRHLILGLLRDAPASGYDLNKRFQASVVHFWWTEHTQIYRALRKMQDDGWVRSEEVVQQGMPNKRVYSLTSAGQRALERWVAQPLDDDNPHEGWLGQLFFSDMLSDAALRHLLAQRLQAVTAARDALAGIQRGKVSFVESPNRARTAMMRLLTQDYGLRVMQAEIDWLQDVLARLPSETDGGTSDEVQQTTETTTTKGEEAHHAEHQNRHKSEDGRG